MKKIGFDITETSDPIYVQIPNNSEYALLTEEIYKKILSEEYRFKYCFYPYIRSFIIFIKFIKVIIFELNNKKVIQNVRNYR